MLKTESLTKVFLTDEVETTALNRVNFEVKPGEFVAIMGPSGYETLGNMDKIALQQGRATDRPSR